MRIQHLTPAILREAANKWLIAENETEYNRGWHPFGSSESCSAVYRVFTTEYGGSVPAYNELCNLMHEMTGGIYNCYDDIPISKRQGARFLWLHFLADVLEDGGL